MSDALPKGQQSAYQRWEMASFGDERPSAVQPVGLTEEELAALREEARTIGYSEGFTQGHTEGIAAGMTDARQDIDRLHSIAAAFSSEVSRANEAIAGDLLTLALDLAKAMLKTALVVRPELVLPVVTEAIRYLPSLQQPALLFLHPDDSPLVADSLGDELAQAGWRVADDQHVERGGCRVETGTNQIDAQLSTRWHRIAASLGQQSEWIAPA